MIVSLDCNKRLLEDFDALYCIENLVYFTDAAIVMLKNKIHRIPIVNEVNQVIGYYESFPNFSKCTYIFIKFR